MKFSLEGLTVYFPYEYLYPGMHDQPPRIHTAETPSSSPSRSLKRSPRLYCGLTNSPTFHH